MAQWVMVAILLVLLAVVFFLYLLARRTVLGFREGMEGGGRRRR